MTLLPTSLPDKASPIEDSTEHISAKLVDVGELES
jgi:hypothetical protein